MTDFSEKIQNVIRNRKITEKDIKNKKNTPKDFNILNDFLKSNRSQDTKEEGYNFEDTSFQDYCNNTSLLQFDNIKKYNSLIRLLNGTYLNKWRPLYRRLLISSKMNCDMNPELSIRLKNDANWLKQNYKDLVLMNNTNLQDKSSPSLQNLKNFKVCMSPSYNLQKNILMSNNDYLIQT